MRVRSARSPACVSADASHRQIARRFPSLTRSAQGRKEAFPTGLEQPARARSVREWRAAIGVPTGERKPKPRETGEETQTTQKVALHVA